MGLPSDDSIRFFYLKKDIHMISEVTFLQTDSLLYNEDYN